MARLIDVDRRKRVLERFYEHMVEFGNVEAAKATRAIINGLKIEPIVDAVEVVHGRWVRKAHDGALGVFHLWHCSVCDTMRARQDPYCGECGAKMDGGADNG